MSEKVKIGIIGGSGLDNPAFLENRQEKFVDTVFGKPSDALITGTIGGMECVLLSRHDRRHSINPTNINYRANILALKQEGVSCIVATTACGSLQEHIQPGDLVILDQFIDRTMHRPVTFYDGSSNAFPGVVHLPMAYPFCKYVRELLISSLENMKFRFHPKGTCVTVEGPRFSTRAESFLYRSYGADIVNMTVVPEVILAKELGMPYAAIALVTDTDCWKETTEDVVNVSMVMNRMKDLAEICRQLLVDVLPKISAKDWTKVLAEYETEVKAAHQYN